MEGGDGSGGGEKGPAGGLSPHTERAEHQGIRRMGGVGEPVGRGAAGIGFFLSLTHQLTHLPTQSKFTALGRTQRVRREGRGVFGRKHQPQGACAPFKTKLSLSEKDVCPKVGD